MSGRGTRRVTTKVLELYSCTCTDRGQSCIFMSDDTTGSSCYTHATVVCGTE